MEYLIVIGCVLNIYNLLRDEICLIQLYKLSARLKSARS